MLPMALPPAPAEHPDVAYTPPEAARSILERWLRQYKIGADPVTVWFPFDGASAYSNAWQALRPWDRIVRTEKDPGAPSVLSGRALLRDAFDGPPCDRVDFIVDNPPYSIIDAVMRLALTHAERGVAFQIPGQHLAPSVRDWMWDEAPPDEQCWLTPRINHDRPHAEKKGSGDVREYSFVTWLRRAGEWRGRMRLARYNWRTGQTWGRG